MTGGQDLRLTKMSTIFLGDVHGKWNLMNLAIAEAIRQTPNAKRIIQVGDFGDGFIGRAEYKAFDWEVPQERKIPIYWIEGNHDNHEFLSVPQNRINPNPLIHYMARGTVKVFGKRTFLFIGGAHSIDCFMRRQGIDWWPEENITYGQIVKILETVKKADVIVSHDYPISFNAFPIHEDPNGNRILLNALLDKYQPEYWFFGHHHESKSGTYKNTKWSCLGELETAILED